MRWNDTLARVALAHAQDMARYSYCRHEGRDASTPDDRFTRAGYRYHATAENIASGQIFVRAHCDVSLSALAYGASSGFQVLYGCSQP